MGTFTLKCIAVSLLLTTTWCRLHLEPFEAHDPHTSKYAVTEATFTNFVDHIDVANEDTYEQRYWFTLDLWKNNTGPIFLYLCGESMCHFPADNAFIMQLGKTYGAAVVALEHRYYGYSMPVSDLGLENMKFLTHNQALADTANFIKFFRRKIGAWTNKLIVVGGSYSGALAAWMRYKYPHLVDGAYSSSGVVNAILDFYKFDEQVKRSTFKSGSGCTDRIHKLLEETKTLWQQDPWKLRKAHNAPYLEWDDFMFYFADIFVETVQYGRRTSLCAFLKDIENDPQRQEKLAQLAINNRAAPHTYAFEYLRTIQIEPRNEFRQWTYQFCSALGYLNTPGHLGKPMRFEEMNLDYWRRYCAKAFDKSIFPDVFNINSMYGDVRVADYATNIIFTNGGEDPWQWAGVRSVTNGEKREVYARVTDADDCGHCADLHAPREDDPKPLKDTRKWVDDILAKWLST